MTLPSRTTPCHPPHDLRAKIQMLLREYYAPPRRAVSSRFPFLKGPAVTTRCTLRSLRNRIDPSIVRKHPPRSAFPHAITQHKSLLRRKLGTSDPKLQESKIQNLRTAISRINGMVLDPGQTCSFWECIGKPTRRRGYTEGMLLSNGKILSGMGGGLCQLSNLLYWMFLHSPLTVTERHHHSMDVFPDSGRTLPFGSGATVLYNFVDLKAKNTSTTSLSIHLWLTDRHLHGAIRSRDPIPEKYHVIERNHCFVRYNDTYFRYNELYRIRSSATSGAMEGEEWITTNFAPVLYPVNQEELQRHGYTVVPMG